MFAAFVSKLFIENFTSAENSSSPLFHSFFTDFICKLNLDYFVTDFNFIELNRDNINFEIGLKSFRDLGSGHHLKVNEPIEYKLTNSFNPDSSVCLINDINYPAENVLYFVHLPIEIINSYSTLSNIPLISSAAFVITYKNFLLNGFVKKEITYSDYVSNKWQINVWTCPKTQNVLIDDPYFLVKRNTKAIDIKSVGLRVKTLLKDFIKSNENCRSKTIIFHIPMFKGDDRKIPWNEEEKEGLPKIIEQTVKSICKEVSCLTIFHDLSTHARFVLTNRHFIKMSAGFDYLKKERVELNETNDYINYSSIYLLDVSDTLNNYYNNRIDKTRARDFFPKAE